MDGNTGGHAVHHTCLPPCSFLCLYFLYSLSTTCLPVLPLPLPPQPRTTSGRGRSYGRSGQRGVGFLRFILLCRICSVFARCRIFSALGVRSVSPRPSFPESLCQSGPDSTYRLPPVWFFTWPLCLALSYRSTLTTHSRTVWACAFRYCCRGTFPSHCIPLSLPTCLTLPPACRWLTRSRTRHTGSVAYCCNICHHRTLWCWSLPSRTRLRHRYTLPSPPCTAACAFTARHGTTTAAAYTRISFSAAFAAVH